MDFRKKRNARIRSKLRHIEANLDELDYLLNDKENNNFTDDVQIRMEKFREEMKSWKE